MRTAWARSKAPCTRPRGTTGPRPTASCSRATRWGSARSAAGPSRRSSTPTRPDGGRIQQVSERSLQPFYPELSRLGTESRLGAGSLLWKEGDPGDSVVLLLDGTLEVVHEAPEGETVVLRTLDAGAVVGEIASTDGR